MSDSNIIKDVTLKSFKVKGVYGLDVAVDFDRHWTNLYGTNGAGRTRFLKCLQAMRPILCTPWSDLPNLIDGKAKPGDEMELRLNIGDYTMVCNVSFRIAQSCWSGEDFIAVDKAFSYLDKDGNKILYEHNGYSAEEAERIYRLLDMSMFDFMIYRFIVDQDTAMEHLSKLPYGVLSGVLAINDEHEWSENLGRMVPWLCPLSADDNITIIIDDIFDNIHPLVVSRYTEVCSNHITKYGKKQIIISSRKIRAMYYRAPCYFFIDGKAVAIHKERTYTRLNGEMVHSCWPYRFYKSEYMQESIPDGEWYTVLKHFEEGDMSVIDDVRGYLKEGKGETDVETDEISD